MHAIDGMACAKRGCDNRGTLGLNIVGPGSFPPKWDRRWRYRCTVCGGTVSTHTGTAYSGLRCARREFDQVASLRVEGVSISATARVTGRISPSDGVDRVLGQYGLESINALIEERCAKVDHWQNSSQRHRWLATALLDIEPRLRKVMGYRHLPRLRDALKRELKIDTTKSTKKAA